MTSPDPEAWVAHRAQKWFMVWKKIMTSKPLWEDHPILLVESSGWLVGTIQIVPAFSWELDQPTRGQNLRQRLYLSCSLCRTNIVCYPSILWTSLKWDDLRVSSIFFWLRPRSVNLAFSSLDVLQPCKRVEHLDPAGLWFKMVQKEKYRSGPGLSHFSTNLWISLSYTRSTPIGSAGVSGVRDYDPRLPSIEICMVQASGDVSTWPHKVHERSICFTSSEDSNVNPRLIHP